MQSAKEPTPAQGGWGGRGSQATSSIAGTGGGSYTAVRLPDRESPKDDGAASKFTAYYPTPLTSPPNESRNPIKVLKMMMSPPSPASESPASVKSPPSPPPAYVQDPSGSISVKFVRKAKVEDGESLFVSGDCAALGEGDIWRAVEMTRDFSICPEGYAWSVTVQGVPRETRYRYLIKGGKSDERWQTEYTMPLTVAQVGEGDQQDEAFTQDDSEVLVRFSMTKSGVTSMAVQGNIDCLGNWNQNKALSLERIPGRQRWEKVASIPSHQLYNFEYKYSCVLESRPGQVNTVAFFTLLPTRAYSAYSPSSPHSFHPLSHVLPDSDPPPYNPPVGPAHELCVQSWRRHPVLKISRPCARRSRWRRGLIVCRMLTCASLSQSLVLSPREALSHSPLLGR